MNPQTDVDAVGGTAAGTDQGLQTYLVAASVMPAVSLSDSLSVRQGPSSIFPLHLER